MIPAYKICHSKTFLARVKTYEQFQYYLVLDDNDPNMIFVEGIDPDERSKRGNVETLRDDNRVKHIRVKGLPTEALSAMNGIDSK
jgi:hypothetical protein